MYFNRKNAEQKNWRMIKKGKHFLFGCSLVFAVGAALVAPSVKADTVETKPEAGSATGTTKPTTGEENATYAAPAVEVAPSTPVAPATVVAEEKAVVVENTTAKTANKEALTQLVEEVKVLDKAGKTEDSLARLNTALDQAQKVLDNAEASQEQVDAALASLKDAVAQLAAKEEKAATVATEEKTEVKEAEAAVAETEVARPRGKRAANRSIDGSLGTGEFTGEGVRQFESVRYSVDGDKTTWTIEVAPDKPANTYAGLAVTSDDTISSIRMIGKSGKFGNNLKDQYLDLPKRPDNMPFANYKVHMSEFRTIGGGIPDNIVYEVVTNGKNHNLFGRFATALVESSLKNNGLNGKSLVGARTSDFPTVGVSLKSKLPAETPKPQPQPETPKPITPAVDAATSGPEITSNLSGKASTPADVTVKAPAGSTVKLYNKDGVVIGEAVANDQGVATVHPTNSLPEGEITATSTPAGGTESAKSAPITVTKSPLTGAGGGLSRGSDNTQLLVSASHIIVYPGDKVNVDVIAAATAIEHFWVPQNPTAISGVLPLGAYLTTAGSKTYRQRNASYQGTVAETQPAGDTVVRFAVTSKKNVTVTRDLKVTVLESAKKYEPVAGAKVEVADVNNVSEAEKTKIIAAAKAANTALPSSATYSVDEKGNLVITYADKSTDKISAAYLVTPAADTEAPAKPVVNTDLTGKAGTKTPVEVTAEKGSTVALYDKDGNKIGEATAGENGKATITPSVNIPAGAVTAKATDAAGNTSVASDPATATPAADTEAPAKPVVNTDLTGKAGTKTPVEVSAEPGSTVALYDKDGNKIGEATAGENGKATITPTVDIPAGAVTAKATDAAGNTSVASDPATATATVVAPTVEIPYSNKDTKEVYVYAGEENSFDIKFKDDSGKIVSATVKQGGNREFGAVAGEANTINTQYGFKANVISSETPATADAPAVITYRGTPAATDGLKPEVLEAATKGENPAGMVLGWRYATATDADGALIENKAVGSSNATDPGSFRVMLKAQSQKYDIVTPTPTEKVTVADPSNITDDELAKIKEKLQLEYSKTNDDANLADKKGKAVADKDGKIQSVTKDADGNLVVTYKDGSQDKKPLSELVTKDTEAPAKPVVNTDLTGKAGTKTPVEVSAEPGSTVALYDKDGNKIGEATAGENGKATITPTVNIPEGNVTAKATDAAGNTSDASEPAKATPAADTEAPAKPVVNTDLTGKAGTKTPVEVSAEPGSTVALYDKDGNKIGEATAGENGKATITPTVAIPEGDVTAKATDASGNTSDASEPAKATAPSTPDTEAPAKPVVNTDLTGKAGTKTPVEVNAEPGSTVALYDKDGNKIGEATAGENGKATITPTVAIPEGNVTAKATDASGNTSDASDPAKATAPSTPDTEAPAKPVVNTDLTGKAGTKTPVEVNAEPGSKVELFDKDGNKIGEGTADNNGKATVTPTVNIPEGNVTAKATDPSGNTSVASDPAKATTPSTPDTEAPAKPVVDTDLTGKAGTKTPVVVSAEPGSKVELFDKDGNKIGEATAGENGKATITPTVNIPEGNVTAKATDAAGNTSDASEPAKATTAKEAKTPAVTPVANPSALTDAEKAKVAEEVKKANPTATDVKVGEDGTATVTYPGGTTANLTPAQTVKEADSNGVKTPAVTPVANPSALTDAEKAKVADEVKKANPTATDVKVGEDGTATVTFPDGSTASLTPAQTVKEADSNGVKTPAVTPVANPSALTDAEKAKVAEEVKKANPTATDVKVGEDGTATVTFPDGSTASLTPAQTVKETDSNGVKTPAVTPVANPSALTDAEKAKVAEEVKKANPTATDVKVGEDGTTTVTFPDGSTANLTPAQTVKEADSNGVKTPAVTPVANPSALTDAEKAKVADEVKKANPTATDVKVGEDGTATVTFPDGSTASLTPAQTVKEADSNGVKTPAVTPVANPSALTDAEKAKVADEVKKANPTATDVKVGEDGTATVTFPDGSKATLTPAQTVKEADKELKDPAVTPVTDPSNLTDAEKAKVAEEVKKANPTVTDVKVGEDGTTTVTYPGGTTAVLPSNKTVKRSVDKELKDPAVTPVVNPSALTDSEKAKVVEEVKKANPTVTDVKVGEDGTTTVTYSDGTTATLTPEKTVKEADSNGVNSPAVTPVVNPSALTDAEKAKVANEVKKANPTVTDVKVGEDGTTTVTFPDGTTAVISPDKTVKKSADKVIKDPAVTPVVNPSALTDAEKAKVADEVKKANPTVTDVKVGEDGTATVTYPDGTTAVIPSDKTVKKSDDKVIKIPAVTPVVNPSALTDSEKAKVADEVKKANPTATDVKVGEDGTAIVTFPDGSTANLTPAQTVKEADSNGVKTPAVTPVANPSALTDAEKAKVADEVKKANPTATDVKVGEDGTATVTFPDGSTASLTPAQTVKEADSNGVKTPAVTPVANPSALTDAEKAKVAEEVKKANPTATDVKVGEDGTATVTFPDGSTASLTPAQTVKEADSNGVKTPAVTPVANPSALTDAEKAKVAEEVKKANPTATDVKVGEDGTTTVTFPDGSTANLTPAQTVKEADSNGVKTPAVTPVANPSALTDAEKAKVADEVKKANPTATDVKVGEDGTATVTFPDGSTASLTPAQTVKEADSNGVKTPAVTPVANPSALTDAEKAKVADEVKKANPTATDVKVGEDGTATVTFPDGSKATLTPAQTVKEADKELKDPAVTPVTDPSNLTDAEKAKVAEEVKKANPTVTDVKVGEDGTTTVTYPGGTTAVLPSNKTVKRSVDKELKDPAVTPVVNPSALTDSEKAKVVEEVKKANPTVTDVKVGEDGTTTVTYSDGTTATLTPEKTVKEADSNGVNSPAVTPVVNPSALADAEKAKVANEVKKANPTVTDVKVGEDGTTTVTFPDGTTAVISPDKTVKKSADKVIKDPAVTPVVNPSALTDAEKAKVADEVKKANPTVTDVKVGEDGTATVTYPDGTTAVIPSDKTVKKSDDKVIKIPAVTPVVNPSALTDSEKAKVADEVKKANPTATDVKVGEDGTAIVTFPDGSTANLTPAQTVKEADSNGVKTPAVTPVANPSALTDAEKAKVADEVKKANPTATDVKVGEDGTATVTFPDGSTASLTPAQTVKEADSNGVKTPAVTPVANPSALTDAEKAKVAEEVKKANPTATDVKVGEDGTATVTFPDGSTASLTPAQTVKEADSNGVKTPAVTPVANPSALTDAEKAKVAEEVKKANPTATDVKVGEDGTTTVTFPDGSTANLTPAQTVKEADSNGVKTPAVTPVANPSALTDAEKAKVAEEVKKANPTATDVKVGEDGTATVTFPDGTTAVIPADKTVKKSSDKAKESDGVKNPSVTPVTDPSNLTDAEKAKVAEEVKKANPTAKDIKVNNDGSVVVTFEDGSVAVIPAEKAVTAVNQDSPAQEPAKKAGAKELPNTGTKQSNASLGLALLAAVTGGLLIAKKREEEE